MRQNIFFKIFTGVLISAVLFTGFYYRNNIQGYFYPCSQPITYRIDFVDSHFGISEDEFKKSIAEAALIWNNAAGKELFRYEDNGRVPVSLVYDKRQQSTEELRSMNLNVDNTEQSYNQLKTTYTKLESQYQEQKSQFDAEEQKFNSDKQSYEQKVEYWNSRGGVSAKQYKEFSAEADRLNATAEDLNKKGDALNKLAEQINALAVTLNRIGSELNKDVSAYNASAQNLGEFEEGLYIYQNLKKKIVIYQYDNHGALVRVLAHELGHALGLEHVDDPEAIMYKLNQSKNSVPTAADISELHRVCK